MKKSIILKYILLIHCTLTFGQQPLCLEMKRDSGLPSNAIYCVYQDHKGFVWLASNEGLHRYDGFQYVSYKLGSQSSLAGSEIQEDQYGRIWYQNFDGFLFYIHQGIMYALAQNPPTDYINYGISDKYLFVIQKKGIDVYDIKSLKRIKTIDVNFETAEQATQIGSDYVFIADDVIYKIDRNLKLSYSSAFVGKGMKVKYVFPYNKQLLLVSKQNETKKLYLLNSDLSISQTYPLEESYIQGCDIIDNQIWFHTPNGSAAYNLTTSLKLQKRMLTDQSTSKVIKDYQNQYWFASVNQGLTLIPHLEDQIYDVSKWGFKRMLKNKTGYLFGTNNGGVLETDSVFIPLQPAFQIKENLPTYFLFEDAIQGHRVFSNNGFYFYNAKNKNFKNYNIALKDVVRLDAHYYAFAASGFAGLLKNPHPLTDAPSVWDGLFLKNRDAQYPDIARLKKSIRGKSIAYLPEKQQIYLASNVGTFTLNPNGVVREITWNNKPFFAVSICELHGEIYLLDAIGTLFKIASNDKVTPVIFSIHTWIGEVKIMKRSGNALLLLTSTDVFLYNGETAKRVNRFISNNAVHDMEMEADHLLLLIDKGIVRLQLDSGRQAIVPKFYIDGLRVQNLPVDWKKPQEITYKNNNITIDFALLEFLNKSIPLYYRINKGHWILIPKETRTLNFPSLRADKYTIEFKVNHKISEQKIVLTVFAPFWKKWWFYMLLSLVIVGLVYFYFRSNALRMQKEISLLNDKVALEKDLSKSVLTSIKSQMNPHFFYNALNTIQAFIFTHDNQKANNYLAKFSKLTRMILEMSEKETVSMQEELVTLKLYLDLEKMRFDRDFNYEITVDPAVEVDLISFPPMLIQPYVENSIKHGLLHRDGEKKVSISFDQVEDLLFVSIDDNGIGRARAAALKQIKSQNHESFASQANEKRLEILNKGRAHKISAEIIDKKSKEGIATGTLVVLVLPIN